MFSVLTCSLPIVPIAVAMIVRDNPQDIWRRTVCAKVETVNDRDMVR